MNWKKLDSEEQLNAIDALSEKQPVVIFKHSTSCSISSASLNRLERKWNQDKMKGVEPYFLDLLANRDISNAIAQRYGVDHQSPQILVIKNKSSVYDNSHLGISFDDLADHVQPISA